MNNEDQHDEDLTKSYKYLKGGVNINSHKFLIYALIQNFKEQNSTNCKRMSVLGNNIYQVKGRQKKQKTKRKQEYEIK